MHTTAPRLEFNRDNGKTSGGSCSPERQESMDDLDVDSGDEVQREQVSGQIIVLKYALHQRESRENQDDSTYLFDIHVHVTSDDVIRP